MKRSIVAATLSLMLLASSQLATHGQPLIDNVFTNSYTGWVDAFPDRGGDWRLSLHNPTLMDTNNANPPAPPDPGANTGLYDPDVLIQDNFTAPAAYDLNATLRTNDDDLLGLVWNYQDSDNYMRFGMRQQSSGSLGGTAGLSVQKVVGGAVTQLSPSTAVAGPDAVDQAMIDNRTPIEVRVAVDGGNYEVFFNGASLASGADSDLADGGKIGFQSWAQRNDSGATPFWGTEVDQVSVTQGANTLYSETFDRRSTAWRPLVMTNAAGTSTLTSDSREDQGNFGVDVNDPWIFQQSNGFEFATVDNTDFIGPAVVVDEPGAAGLSDYRMQARLGSTDNDGFGVLVRVADDDNFYRVTFTNQATGGDATRAPMGMSVQKVKDGVWSQLYRDDDAPLFVYTPGDGGATPADADFPAFDVSVAAVGNQLTVQVIDPMGNVIDYPVITDADDPILAGTVGLHTWGANNTYFTNFGGQPGPLVTAIPEPTCVALASASLGAMFCLRRRRRVTAWI